MTSSEQQTQDTAVATPMSAARAEARKRLQAKREFGSNLVAYVVINTFLVVVWALTGAGYFWPAWVLAGWGVGLLLHAWETFVRQPITEAEIDQEMRRRA